MYENKCLHKYVFGNIFDLNFFSLKFSMKTAWLWYLQNCWEKTHISASWLLNIVDVKSSSKKCSCTIGSENLWELKKIQSKKKYINLFMSCIRIVRIRSKQDFVNGGSCIISLKWRICEEYMSTKPTTEKMFAAMECESVEISGFLQVRFELWSFENFPPQKWTLIHLSRTPL